MLAGSTCIPFLSRRATLHPLRHPALKVLRQADKESPGAFRTGAGPRGEGLDAGRGIEPASGRDLLGVRLAPMP